MTPAAMLANCCNHDLSVLLRFSHIASDMPPGMQPLLLKDMIETITDHEYYVGGYLAKGGESTQGLLHCLHDAVLQHSRSIAAKEVHGADSLENAQRLFRRLSLALNKRQAPGLLVMGLAGRPITHWCDAVRTAVAALHAAQLVHLDLKPANILQDAEGKGCLFFHVFFCSRLGL